MISVNKRYCMTQTPTAGAASRAAEIGQSTRRGAASDRFHRGRSAKRGNGAGGPGRGLARCTIVPCPCRPAWLPFEVDVVGMIFLSIHEENAETSGNSKCGVTAALTMSTVLAAVLTGSFCLYYGRADDRQKRSTRIHQYKVMPAICEQHCA
ncbi:MAG: hypothetical protein ACI9ZF_003036 [Bradyrhizobium sp.]|jgi:hypothetical protein